MPFVSRSPFPFAPRLPPGMALMNSIREKLTKAEKQLTTAKKAATAHKKQMMVSRYTPEGYKKAVAEQKKLDTKVKTLEAEVARLRKALFSIG
jgi:SMC interacting uncharacterized protein involved in chromosome segregation